MSRRFILFFIKILTDTGILTPINVARMKYFYKLHRWPDFEHPRDLNEVINYLKFYTDTSAWAGWTDKYAVREKLREAGFGDNLVQLYGHWTDTAHIDWDSLPEKFVMKSNNGSGDVRIVRKKSDTDLTQLASYFAKMLHRTYGRLEGEPHYRLISPCIIAEELLDSSTQPNGSSSLVDYKIWCINGSPEYIWTCHDRTGYHAKVGVYDTEWNYHPEHSIFTSHYVESDRLLEKPTCLDRMLEMAAKLSTGFPVVRVDLYEVNGKVYFGEMTFTSQGGYMDYFTDDFLHELGQSALTALHRQ